MRRGEGWTSPTFVPARAGGDLPVGRPSLSITVHVDTDSQICLFLCSLSYQDKFEVSLASVFTSEEMLPPFDYFEHRRAWYVTNELLVSELQVAVLLIASFPQPI
jgi:hypothetical protein